MTIRTKAAGPRAATAHRHSTDLPTPRPADPAAAAARATVPAGARTGGGTATRVAGGAADRPGAPGATPGAHPACAGSAQRTGAARRPGRTPAGATTPTAGASLPADRDRARRDAARGGALPTRGPHTGPEGHRTTGEGA
ncbi:hypothetical protein [Streptomyces erythrochromogenes]|uniref:hypothetical protein n=1 Tax=Streptomyces erythrochromogenes TaxID=285574 RepID=UPI003696703D